MDKLGTRRGFAIAVGIWSVAAVGHAVAERMDWMKLPTINLDAKTGLSVVLLTGAAAGFAIMRFLLGLGEAGNFPASIKTVAEWFPKKERALATGIFNSGTNVGAIITPLVVPWVTLHWGWEWAFVATGVTGFAWLAWWLAVYRLPEEHPRLSPAELAYIRSDPVEKITPIPWARLIGHRQTWAFAIGKFMTDPVWWLYLFWIPDFLNRSYGLTLTSIGLPIVVIYLIADIGSIGGGWLSSALIKRGWSLNAARQTAMFICAAAVVRSSSPRSRRASWTSVLLVSLAASAHQAGPPTCSRCRRRHVPRTAVGSARAGGMAGAVGGMFISDPRRRDPEPARTAAVPIFFIIAGFAYRPPSIIHLLVPAGARPIPPNGDLEGMRPFIHDDFLLSGAVAHDLYARFARDLPIVDYHCHLSPELMAADHHFRSITEIWLEGDHYKWRAMRADGVPERAITGGASDWEKFEAWARTVPHTLRNPLYHWTHLELSAPSGSSACSPPPPRARSSIAATSGCARTTSRPWAS
jgi:ACS family hexuronate transporter-like MFS transporter